MSDETKKVIELDEEEMNQINGGAQNKKKKPPTIYKCGFCGEEFADKRKYKKHVESYHS